MAISVPSKSAQYTLYTNSPRGMVAGHDWGTGLKTFYAKLTFTAAGFTTAALGDIPLIFLPPGLVRVHTLLSWVSCPIGTATSDFDLGWADYINPDTGATVTGDLDGFAASLDVGGAAIRQVLPLPAAGGQKTFDSRDGVVIACSFDTANSPATGDLELFLSCTLENTSY